MNLAVSPISFKSDTNLLAAAMNGNSTETETVSEPSGNNTAIKQDEISKEKLKEALRELKNEDTFEHAKETEETDTEATAKKTSNTEGFNAVLNNRKWEKEYLPESDLIYVSQKKNSDGTEYIIEKDGTVKMTSPDGEPEIIMPANKDMAKQFGKIKAKQSDAPDEKKTLWMSLKEKFADVWKFFTVTGTMTAATTKGVVQGAIAGAGVIAAASIIKGTEGIIKKTGKFSDIFKHPFKTAGKAGKILAAIAAAGTLAVNLVLGKLEANEKSAVVEHKVDVPHVN